MHNRRLSARKLNKISTSFNTQDVHRTCQTVRRQRKRQQETEGERDSNSWLTGGRRVNVNLNLNANALDRHTTQVS